jgi:hypothetical protein
MGTRLKNWKQDFSNIMLNFVACKLDRLLIFCTAIGWYFYDRIWIHTFMEDGKQEIRNKDLEFIYFFYSIYQLNLPSSKWNPNKCCQRLQKVVIVIYNNHSISIIFPKFSFLQWNWNPFAWFIWRSSYVTKTVSILWCYLESDKEIYIVNTVARAL